MNRFEKNLRDQVGPPYGISTYNWSDDFVNYLCSFIIELRAVRRNNPYYLLASPKKISASISDLNYLDTVAKKLCVVSKDSLIIENGRETSYKIYEYEYSSSGYSAFKSSCYLYSNDAKQLSDWCTRAKPIINNGKVLFVPHVTLHSSSCVIQVGIGNRLTEEKDNSTYLPKFQAHYDPDVRISYKTLIPLFNFILPVVEEAPYHILAKVMEDNKESFESFADLLMLKFLEVEESALGSEQFSKQVKRIEIEIKNGLNSLINEHKKIEKSKFFELSGLALAAWSFAVYSFMCDHNGILQAIGPGGLVTVLAKEYADYFRKKYEIKKDSLYFLYALGKSMRKDFFDKT